MPIEGEGDGDCVERRRRWRGLGGDAGRESNNVERLCITVGRGRNRSRGDRHLTVGCDGHRRRALRFVAVCDCERDSHLCALGKGRGDVQNESARGFSPVCGGEEGRTADVLRDGQDCRGRRGCAREARKSDGGGGGDGQLNVEGEGDGEGVGVER